MRKIKTAADYEYWSGIAWEQSNLDMNSENDPELTKLYEELFQYRREHNIYEVGDKYVMLKIWHDDLMIVEDGDMDEPCWNTRIIRHITDEEREVGHRI